ncbi:hypothetical protein G6F68_001680 [Rhizopus microsporus]|nr:hypothetical protein G6F67_002589 [Rhizopus microsporus]KAG1267737.1 hypothetical protein G6F68_001680 [Rhizopus microsporus]
MKLTCSPYMLTNVDTTEADLTVKMWGGLFEKLFRRTKLRYKWGESVGGSSGAADSPGFKVDLRVIKDTLSRRNKEADTDNMELTRMGASVVKTCSDKSKLLIESMCILDCLTTTTVLFSLRLLAPGLYVAVKEAIASISSSMSKLKDFRDVAKLLFKFKEATISVANIRLQGGDNSTSIGTSNNSNNSDTTSWLRGNLDTPKGKHEKNGARCLFQYYNRLIDSVEICGIVAAIDKNRRVATFYVDDSTGIIECGIWHEKIIEIPQLGSLVRARGKVNEYNGRTQIFCLDIFIMQDPNYELLHFSQAIHYRSECKPLEIETPESRSAETEDRSDTMSSTTNMITDASVKAALVAYLNESSIQEFFPWELRKVPMIVDLIRSQNGMVSDKLGLAYLLLIK